MTISQEIVTPFLDRLNCSIVGSVMKNRYVP